MGNNGAPQSRAGGLTRAILDTFPIVKFGTQPATSVAKEDSERQTSTTSLEMKRIQPANEDISRELPLTVPAKADGPDAIAPYPMDTGPNSGVTENSQAVESSSTDSNHLLPDGRSHDVGEGTSCNIKASGQDDAVPASVSRETCPICIVDFEEGDDIRLLPCEGKKHSFHQQCVDEWLLKLPTCPVCRKGE